MDRKIIIIDNDKLYSKNVEDNHYLVAQDIFYEQYNTIIDFNKEMEIHKKFWPIIINDNYNFVVIIISDDNVISFVPEIISNYQLESLEKLNEEYDDSYIKIVNYNNKKYQLSDLINMITNNNIKR